MVDFKFVCLAWCLMEKGLGRSAVPMPTRGILIIMAAKVVCACD
jgi:hypothetical protein